MIRPKQIWSALAAGVLSLGAAGFAAVVSGPQVAAHVPDTPPSLLTVYVPNEAVATGVFSVLQKDSGWRGMWISGTLRSFGLGPQPPTTLYYEVCTEKHGCEREVLATIVPGEFGPDDEQRKDFTLDRHYGPGQGLLSARLVVEKGSGIATQQLNLE